jgi:hypothetical protein
MRGTSMTLLIILFSQIGPSVHVDQDNNISTVMKGEH